MEEASFGFDNAPIGLVITRHRLIEHYNTRFARMFGYGPVELAGKSIALLYPSNREYVDVGKWGLSSMSETLRYEDQRIMMRKNSIQFWCRVCGQSTTPDDPYARCVWSFTDLSDQRPVVMLTRREREIAMFVVEGLTNKEIARRLDVSHRTVEAHRSRMMEKLNARNTAELISGLVGLPAETRT